MELVPGFGLLLQGLAATMTAPTFESFVTVVTGWVFAPRRTVTRMIMAAGDTASKHYSSYHRVFSAARWSLDAMGLAVFRLIEPFCGEQVMLAIDDTLARKRGLKVFGTGMHHDARLSSRNTTILNWGHNWVVLGVIVELPFRPRHYFCLPILFRLYLNKQKATEHGGTYRKRTALAVEMLEVVCNHRKNRRFHAIGDASYNGQTVLAHLPENCDLTTRLAKNTRLYDAPPPRKPGRGRPRVRGEKLPTAGEMFAEPGRHTTLDIYGRNETARVSDVCARVYAVPDRPLRVVVVEAIQGGRGQEAFYSTCHEATAEQVIGWYAARWSIEVCFHDSKQSLGFEQPQGWSRLAVERTAPIAMLLYSLIVLWFASEGVRHYQPLECPWYVSKTDPSFADMLATLRRESVTQRILSLRLTGPGSRKIRRILEQAAVLAA